MKTIGMIGGMSWESTVEYYRIINQETARRLGGYHSAKSVLVSVDFDEIERMQAQDAWDEAGAAMVRAAVACEAGGADFIVLCTNTMHKVYDQAARAVGIPFLHIADATAARIRTAGLGTVGLLGTRYTMEDTFYRGRLEDRHGLRALIPNEAGRAEVHRIIYDELVHGEIRDASRARFVQIIAELQAAGAEGVIAGCTEIGLLIHQDHVPLPLFDTARIHAEEAVRVALEG